MILFIYNHFRYYLQFQTIAIITNTSLQLLRLHAAINKDVIKMIKMLSITIKLINCVIR